MRQEIWEEEQVGNSQAEGFKTDDAQQRGCGKFSDTTNPMLNRDAIYE